MPPPPPGARGGQGIQVAVGKGSIDAGNRPRLVARTPSDGKTMAFDFVDISGSATPAFVEHVEFTMTDADHHMEHWTFVLPGDQRLRAHFDLTRGR
jgi:hypothetical protein